MDDLWMDLPSLEDLILGDESEGFMTCEEEDDELERARAYKRRLAEEEAEIDRIGNYYVVGEVLAPLRFDDDGRIL